MTPASEERIKILDMIDQGVINADEGFTLLQALEGSEGGESLPQDDAQTDSHTPSPEEINQWKRWWLIPFWTGTSITVIAGGLMYWSWSTAGFGLWFACSWAPFAFGVVLLALAWGSSQTPWMHVRVRQKPGKQPENMAISFPLPIRLAAWGLRTFGHWIPNTDATAMDELILALNATSKGDTPFFIDVHEGDEGERVQVFIG
jgi:hypothetical protein